MPKGWIQLADKQPKEWPPKGALRVERMRKGKCAQRCYYILNPDGVVATIHAYYVTGVLPNAQPVHPLDGYTPRIRAFIRQFGLRYRWSRNVNPWKMGDGYHATMFAALNDFQLTVVEDRNRLRNMELEAQRHDQQVQRMLIDPPNPVPPRGWQEVQPVGWAPGVQVYVQNYVQNVAQGANYNGIPINNPVPLVENGQVLGVWARQAIAYREAMNQIRRFVDDDPDYDPR